MTDGERSSSDHVSQLTRLSKTYGRGLNVDVTAVNISQFHMEVSMGSAEGIPY